MRQIQVKKWMIAFVFMMLLQLNLFQGMALATQVQKKISGVPLINQHPELPTGCEITALTMFINYHGLDWNKMQVMQKIPMGKRPSPTKGVWYGADPREAFVGDPTKISGFGVYHQPIEKLLKEWFPGRVVNASGQNLSELLDQVEKGNPVLIWLTIPRNNDNLKEAYFSKSWKTPKGEKFTWIAGEHAMVIVGYSENRKKIFLNDPYTGKKLKIPFAMVNKSYESLGKQALYLREKKEEIKKRESKVAYFDNTPLFFEEESLDIRKYKIDGELYIALRDYAKILMGRENEFDVDFQDGNIHVISHQKYSGEFLPVRQDSNEKISYLTESPILFNNFKLDMKGYLIDSNTYYRLEDLAKLFGVEQFYKEDYPGIHLKMTFQL